MKPLLKKQQGQTSVEYMLILVVAITIGITFYNKMNEFMLQNPNSPLAKRLKIIESTLNQRSGYKIYRIPR